VLLALPITMVLAPWFGAPRHAYEHQELHATAEPVLVQVGDAIAFRGPGTGRWCALELRPTAGLPRGAMRPAQIALHGDGERLDSTPVTFVESQQRVRVTFAPRSIGELRLTQTDGSVPLFFAPGTVVLHGADAHGNGSNGALAALLAVVPTFLALALGVLCGQAAGLATVMTVVVAIAFVMTLGDVGPFGLALLALLRGQRLGTAPVFAACLPFLAVGSLAMIVAMVLRPWQRR
jgi:hypothetical protein